MGTNDQINYSDYGIKSSSDIYNDVLAPSQLANGGLARTSSMQTSLPSIFNKSPSINIDSSIGELLNKNTSNSVKTNVYDFGKNGDNFYSGTINGSPTVVPQSKLGSLDPGSVDAANIGGKGFSSSLDNKNSINWGMDGWGGLGLGIGQLGLGVMSYLDNKKTADKQRALLGQQYVNNTITMKNRASDRQHTIDVFK